MATITAGSPFLNAGGGTVIYTGTGSYSIPTGMTTVNNLLFGGGGSSTKTTTVAIIANGTFITNASTTASIGADLTVKGTLFTISGTFNHTAGTLIFDGAVTTASAGAGSHTFNNITIGTSTYFNSTTGNAVTLNGTLTNSSSGNGAGTTSFSHNNNLLISIPRLTAIAGTAGTGTGLISVSSLTINALAEFQTNAPINIQGAVTNNGWFNGKNPGTPTISQGSSTWSGIGKNSFVNLNLGLNSGQTLILDCNLRVTGTMSCTSAGGVLANVILPRATGFTERRDTIFNLNITSGQFNMVDGGPTLTGNSPFSHTVTIENVLTIGTNGIFIPYYANSNFFSDIRFIFSGTGSPIVNSSSNTALFGHVTFNGGAPGVTIGMNLDIRRGIFGTSTTPITFTAGRQRFLSSGATLLTADSIGVSGGATMTFWNIYVTGPTTRIYQNITTQGTSPNSLNRPLAVDNSGVFSLNGFTFNVTSPITNQDIVELVNGSSNIAANPGTVNIDLGTGNYGYWSYNTNFENLTIATGTTVTTQTVTVQHTVAGNVVCNGTFTMQGDLTNRPGVTFNKSGTQTVTGTGTLSLNLCTINSSATTVNSTMTSFRVVPGGGNPTSTGLFTNNGTFTATTGTLDRAACTDSRSTFNTTFGNLTMVSQSLNAAPNEYLINMNLIVTGTLTGLGTNGYFIFPTSGTQRTIRTNNLSMSASFQIGFSSVAGATTTNGFVNTLEIQGSVTHTSGNGNSFISTYSNGANRARLQLLINTQTTSTLDFCGSANSHSYALADIVIPATATASPTIAISGSISDGIYNQSSQNVTFITATQNAGKINTVLPTNGPTTVALSRTGTGTLTLFNFYHQAANTLTTTGDITFSGTNTNTNIGNGSFEIGASSLCNFGSSTLTFTAPTQALNLAASPASNMNFGTSTLVFNNNGAAQVITPAVGPINLYNVNVTGATGPLLNSGLTYNINGVYDGAATTLGRSGGTNVVNVVNGGKFRTSNLNGLTGSTSTAITNNNTTLTMASGGTIEYYATSGTQIVTGLSSYCNVILLGAATKQLSANTTILASNILAVETGVTFNTITFNIAGVSGTATLLVKGTLQTQNTSGFNGTTVSFTANTTNLTITLNSGSVIEYNGSGSQAITNPGTGYRTLTISNTGSRSLAASVVVQDVLNLAGNSITFGNNDLTLGTSALSVGTLNYTSGYLATTGTGGFVRWFPTSGLPTVNTSGTYFPVGTTSADRSVRVYFTSATAFSTGGTIKVVHNNLVNESPVSPTFLDGVGGNQITISQRTNTNWAISTPNTPVLAGGQSIGLYNVLTNCGLAAVVSRARLIQTLSAVGTSVNGSGVIQAPILERTGLTVANLTNSFYMGSDNIGPIVIAVATGNWGTGATWSTSPLIPTATDFVVIPSPYTVTLNVAGVLLNLNIDNGGSLDFSTNTLTPSSGGIITIDGTATTQKSNGFYGSSTTSISNTNSPTINFGSNGLVNYNAAGAQSVSGMQYANLKITNRTGVSIVTLDPSVPILISNQFDISGLTANTQFTTTNSTVNYNGSISQTIAGTGVVVNLFNYYNLISSGTGARVLDPSGSNAITVTNSFTPGSNTYTITGNTFTYSGNGPLTIAAFDYNNLTSAGTGARTLANGTIRVAAIFTQGTSTYTPGTNTFIYNGTGTQIVRPISYYNLTVNGGRGVNAVTMNSGTMNIAGALSLDNSVTYTFTAGNIINYNGTGSTSQTIAGGSWFTYLTLNINTTLTGAATVILDPTNNIRVSTGFNPTSTPGGAGYTITNSTVQFTSAMTIPAFVYNNINCSGNNYTLASSGTIDVKGAWTNSGGTTLSTIAGSTVRLSGTSSQNIPNYTVWNNLYLVNSRKLIVDAASVQGTLTIDGCVLDLTTNSINGSFNIGSSAANPGSLSAINGGYIDLGNPNPGNYIGRWFGTSGLPTDFSTQAGLFPLYNNGQNHFAYLAFSNSTAFSTGGLIRIKYPNNYTVTGVSATNSLVDGGVTLTKSGNCIWVFETPTAPTLSAGQSINLRLQNSGQFTPSTVANVRAVGSSTGHTISIVGTFSAGTGTQADPQGNRTGVTLSQLTSPGGGGNGWCLAVDRSLATVVANGNWTTTTTWQGSVTPSSNDDILVPSPYTLNMTGNQSCNNLTVDLGGTISISNSTLSMASSTTALINGKISFTSASGLNQNSSSAISTSNSPTITLGSASTVEFASSSPQTFDVRSYANLSSASTGARTISGAINVSGIFTPFTNFYTVAGSTVNFNGANGQTIPAFSYNNLSSSNNDRIYSGVVNIAGTFTPGSGIPTTTGNTINFNGTGIQTIPAFNYNKLGVQNAGRGAANVTFANSGVVSVNDEINLVTLTGPSTYAVAGSTVEYRGNNLAAISTLPSGFAFNNLTISGNGTTNYVGNNFTVNGALSIPASAVLNLNANNWTLGTGSTASISGTLMDDNTSGTNTFNNAAITIPTGGLLDITRSTASLSTSGALTFNGGTVGGASGSTGSFTVGSLAMTGDGTLGAGNFTVSGASSIPSTRTLNITSTTGTKTFTGTVDIDGTWSNSANSGITFGTGLNVNSGSTFTPGTGNQTFSGTGNIAGTFATVVTIPNLNATGSVTNARTNGLTISNSLIGSGTFTQGTNSLLTISNSTAPTVTTLVATTSGNTVVYSGNAANIRGLTYNNLTLSGTGTHLPGAAVTINSNLNLNAGTINNATNGITMTNGATGNMAGGAITNALSAPGSDRYNLTYTSGTTTGVELSTTGNDDLNNLTVNTGGNLAIDKSANVNGALNLNASNTLVINGFTLSLNGTATGAGTITGSTTSNLNIGGTGALGTITFTTGGANQQLNNLVMNRTSTGTATLGNDLSINTILTLTNGALSTGSNKITLAGSSTMSEIDGQSRLIGNVEATRNLNTTGTYVSFAGMGLDFKAINNAPGVTTVTRVTGTALNGNPPSTPCCANNTSILRYFDIVPTNNSNLGVRLRFNYLTAELNGQSETNLELFKAPLPYNVLNTGWQPFRTLVDVTNNLLENGPVMNSFSRIGVSNELDVPLPVVVKSFYGEVKGNDAHLFLGVSANKEASQFKLLRSANGELFETISVQAAKPGISGYQFVDREAFKPGVVSYFYRIVQVDENGAEYQVDPIILRHPDAKIYMEVYPNAFFSKITIRSISISEEKVNAILFDIQGKKVKEEQLKFGNGEADLNGLDLLPAGIYHLKILHDSGVETFKVLKK